MEFRSVRIDGFFLSLFVNSFFFQSLEIDVYVITLHAQLNTMLLKAYEIFPKLEGERNSTMNKRTTTTRVVNSNHKLVRWMSRRAIRRNKQPIHRQKLKKKKKLWKWEIENDVNSLFSFSYFEWIGTQKIMPNTRRAHIQRQTYAQTNFKQFSQFDLIWFDSLMK